MERELLKVLIWIVCILAIWHFASTLLVYTSSRIRIFNPLGSTRPEKTLFVVFVAYFVFVIHFICICCTTKFVFVVHFICICSTLYISPGTVYPGYHLGRLKDAFTLHKLHFVWLPFNKRNWLYKTICLWMKSVCKVNTISNCICCISKVTS